MTKEEAATFIAKHAADRDVFENPAVLEAIEVLAKEDAVT